MSNRDRINKSYQSIKVSIREMERVDKSTGKELVNISFLNYSLNFYNFFFS